ncbi:hypothetical protein [Streptomyces sp. NPDC053560]|uniref:hypothetical protein n=1 Tax=Streptomyces sp. NPDC053560 TaxID=3365711 RepID=UPI0037D2D009
MTTSTPPSTPTVAIARILRDLGLVQGRGCDFRVVGDYRNGERIGTYVLPLSRRADATIADRADDIERLAAEGPYPFRVSVRYTDGDRPMASVANYGSRVRETPSGGEPSTTPEPEPAPVEPAPDSPGAGFFRGARERAWQSQQVRALGWSARQAELVAAAGSIGLQYRADGVLRHYPVPGRAGTPVDEQRLAPLVKAGFIVVDEPHGPGSKRVSLTRDGATALLLWRRWRPTPAVKDRKEEREPLRPLLGGEYANRQAIAETEADRQRQAETEALHAALEELREWEERDERLWGVWAKVQGITHRLGRKRPTDWVPTEEEIAEHRIAPELVAELYAAVGRPAPRPELPKTSTSRPMEVRPLEAVPDEQEQLSLFDANAA